MFGKQQKRTHRPNDNNNVDICIIIIYISPDNLYNVPCALQNKTK
jgi:hypothetical protein